MAARKKIGLDAYRLAAKRLCHIEGEVEIDDNAVVSKGEDDGAYVAAWIWIPDEDVLPRERRKAG